MFGFGHMPELIVVLVLALLIFGPRKVPEIGQALGRGIREFKKATTEIESGARLDTSEVKSSEKALET